MERASGGKSITGIRGHSFRGLRLHRAGSGSDPFYSIFPETSENTLERMIK